MAIGNWQLAVGIWQSGNVNAGVSIATSGWGTNLVFAYGQNLEIPPTEELNDPTHKPPYSVYTLNSAKSCFSRRTRFFRLTKSMAAYCEQNLRETSVNYP